METDIKKVKIIEKILNIGLDVLIFIFGIVLLISLYIGIQTKIFRNDYANFFGYSFFEVQTGSMAPKINAGDWVIVKITKEAKLWDIITYRDNEENINITHRVIQMYSNNYITMGDASKSQDKPIKSDQVIGVVKKIMPGFGIFRKTLFNPPVLIAIIITMFIASTLFKKNNKIDTKSKAEIYGSKIFNILLNKIKKLFKDKDVFKNAFKKIPRKITIKRNEEISQIDTKEESTEIVVNTDSTASMEKETIENEDIRNLPNNEVANDNLDTNNNADAIPVVIEETKDLANDEEVTNTTSDIKDNVDDITITSEDVKETVNDVENNVNSKEEIEEDINDDEVYREPDIEKTAIYRYITVNPNELKEIKDIKIDEEVVEKLDEKETTEDNTTESVNSENLENDKTLENTENSINNEEKIEEINEDLDEESKTKLELEELNARCGKKSKNIIEKIINIKKEEIKELIDILQNGEKENVNETSIKNEFLDVFANVRFYNNYIETTSSNKRFDTKAENTIRQLGNFLVNEYGGSDKKYNDKVAKYINIFTAIADLEQTWNSRTDYKRKYQFYRKTLINYYKGEELSEKNIRYLINSILKTRKKYVGIVDYLLKKLESNTFELKINKLTNMKNTYGLELIHNISFNKMYSEYVIDKTYSDGIIAEDKISVLITLLLGKITRDMLESNFDNKYILYVPNSLYDKERKFERLLKMFDNEYAKSHIKVLVTIKDFLDNRSLIKSFIKDGYKFSIVYDKEIKILYEEFGNLYIVDEIFIDKDTMDTKKLFAFIPEEIYSKFVDEDILSKVDSYGSE